VAWSRIIRLRFDDESGCSIDNLAVFGTFVRVNQIQELVDMITTTGSVSDSRGSQAAVKSELMIPPPSDYHSHANVLWVCVWSLLKVDSCSKSRFASRGHPHQSSGINRTEQDQFLPQELQVWTESESENQNQTDQNNRKFRIQNQSTQWVAEWTTKWVSHWVSQGPNQSLDSLVNVLRGPTQSHRLLGL